MTEQLEHFLMAGWSLRWWITAAAFAVLVFLWRTAEYDARTLNKVLDMRAADIRELKQDNANLRRTLYLRDLADGKTTSRWGR